MSIRVKSSHSAALAAQPPTIVCDQIATARYIADMSAELAQMAGKRQLDLLTYLLNMARVEAEMVARSDPRLEQNGALDGDF